MPNPEPLIEIVEYTDPYCTWCWASEPVLRKIKEVYGDQVEISFKMGGLVRDIGDFYDPLNRIGGENIMEQVAAHWLDASRRHGMPVDPTVFREAEREFRSTYPANIACKAAQMQGEELGERYLRRLREAAAAERKLIHRREVQLELAKEIALDMPRFAEALDNGTAQKAFQQDLDETRRRGISGFPTFLIKNRQGGSRTIAGYRPFEELEMYIELLSNGQLKRQQPKDILTFVSKYGKVATKEIAEVFDLTINEAEQKLQELVKEGLLFEVKAGTGSFWLPSLRMDPRNGEPQDEMGYQISSLHPPRNKSSHSMTSLVSMRGGIPEYEKRKPQAQE